MKKIIIFIFILSVIGVGVFAVVWWITHKPIMNEYVVHLRDEQGKVVDFQYGSIPSLTNPDYYKNVRQQLIDARADFIDADLSGMQLRVYKQGAVVTQVEIKAKGKVGSWSQTPSGFYKAETKEKAHRSSFEPVSMKWNIPFQGNYFIHGWPTYVSNGQSVTSSYSGGCIRLTDDDAKKVYDLVTTGMPILVHQQDITDTVFSYDVNIPELSGKTYLAADLSNNFVFLEKNQDALYPLADFTKLVNAFVVSEYMNYNIPITVTDDMLVSTNIPRLKAKQKYTPYELIFPMILEHSNEAAETLSRPLGRTRFISLMNEKVQSLGMKNTVITEPTGATTTNITTAKDLFQLVKSIKQYRKFILDMSANPTGAMVYGPIRFSDLKVSDPFMQTEGYQGSFFVRMDTNGSSTTQAVVAVYQFVFKGVVRDIVFISFDTENPAQDVQAMREYINRVYK